MKISDLYDDYKVFSKLFTYLSRIDYPNLYNYLNKSITNNSSNTGYLNDDYYLNYSSNKNTSILVDNLIDKDNFDMKVTGIIISRYASKWDKIIHTMELEYNAIENYSMVEEESSNNSGESSSSGSATTETKQKSNLTTTNDIEHKRSGYNSSTYEPDSKDTQTTLVKGSPDENYTNATNSTTDSLSTSNEGSRTLTRSGNIGVTTSQQMIESELKLREYNINKMMYDDIDKILTSSLYI